MATATSGAVPVARSEPRARTALLLEAIALRHQIAVLERGRTRRPCFHRFDRLFWILLSRWSPDWRDSPVIAQPETVLRWCRHGWSALWLYRSRGRWRGGRPGVSREVCHLIERMARENFLWSAPRIRGELLTLGLASPKPLCRGTCLHEADGRDNRGGLFYAIKRVRSTSIPSSDRGERPTCIRSPIGPGSSDSELLRLRRHGLESGAALPDHGRPQTLQ